MIYWVIQENISTMPETLLDTWDIAMKKTNKFIGIMELIINKERKKV